MPTPVRVQKGQKIQAKIDYQKLRQLLNKGLDADRLMSEFSLKSKTTLRNAIQRLAFMDKKFYEVANLFGRGPSSEIKYTSLGIRIYPSRLKDRFNEGDTFSIDYEEDKIILKKI